MYKIRATKCNTSVFSIKGCIWIQLRGQFWERIVIFKLRLIIKFHLLTFTDNLSVVYLRKLGASTKSVLERDEFSGAIFSLISLCTIMIKKRLCFGCLLLNVHMWTDGITHQRFFMWYAYPGATFVHKCMDYTVRINLIWRLRSKAAIIDNFSNLWFKLSTKAIDPSNTTHIINRALYFQVVE